MSHCSTCSFCCKVLAVEPLNKPAGKWCQHAKPGKGGCSIYSERPAPCQTFSCLWLASQLRAETTGEKAFAPNLRPDRSKVMLTMGGPKNTNLVLHVDPGTPGAWRDNTGIVLLVNACLAAGNSVFIVAGEKRTMLSPEAANAD